MKIQAVQICKDYGDFLAETLPLNKMHFDYMVVVTSEDDHETRRICEYHNVHCVIADFGDSFSKAAGINEGLEVLEKRWDDDTWVVHLDADIALPPQTRQMLQQANLDPSFIYGIDRHNFANAKEWFRHKQLPKLQHEANAYVHSEVYPIGTRFCTSIAHGYVPIGFFQLWHPRESGVTRYPVGKGAGTTDMKFALLWPRRKRGFIPEIIGYHLESENAPQGINWEGRKTRRFDPHRHHNPWRWIRRKHRDCRFRHRHRHHHNPWHHHHCHCHHHHHHPHPYFDINSDGFTLDNNGNSE